jgi:hypothetical protein
MALPALPDGYFIHGKLRHGGDGQARIDADIALDSASVYDVKIRIAMYLQVFVNHSGFPGIRHGASPEDMGGGWSVEKYFQKDILRDAADFPGIPFHYFLADGDICRDFLLSFVDDLHGTAEKVFLPDHLHSIVHILHHQKNYQVGGPVEFKKHFQELIWVENSILQQLQSPED